MENLTELEQARSRNHQLLEEQATANSLKENKPTKEIWKDVLGYKGLYKVSNLGNIKSLPRRVRCMRKSYRKFISTRLSPGRKMKVYTSNKGYQDLDLCKKGKITSKLVHILVLEAFVGKCPKGMQCCHGIKGPSVNTLDNLRWGTISSNNKEDKIRDGVALFGNRNHATKMKESEVKKIKRYLRKMSYIDLYKKLKIKSRNLKARIKAIAKEETWYWLKL